MRGKSRHIPSRDEPPSAEKIALVEELLARGIEAWAERGEENMRQQEEAAHRAKYEAEYCRIDAREALPNPTEPQEGGNRDSTQAREDPHPPFYHVDGFSE